MKKLFLFALLNLVFSQCVLAQKETDFNLTPEQETEYWNYFIKRFSPKGFHRTTHPKKFYGDIKVYLINGNTMDSLAVQKAIAEVAPLIPNKIDITNVKEDANLIIELLPEGYYKKNHKVVGPYFKNTKSLLRSFTQTDNHGGYALSGIKLQYFSSIIGDKVPQEKRAMILRYFVINGLTDIPKIVHEWTIFTPDLYQEVGDEPEIFFKSFKEKEKFCLSKLYATNLDAQMKHFLSKEYNWWQKLNFYYDSDVISTYKILIYVFSFLILIALSYKTIIVRKFKKAYYEYLANALLFSFVFEVMGYFNSYLRIYKEFPINLSQIESPYLLEHALITVPISIGIATILYFLERYLIKDKYKVSVRILLKATFILIVLVLFWFVISNFLVSQPLSQHNFMVVKMVWLYCFVIAIARAILLYFREHSDAMLRKKDVELSQLKELKAKAEVASLHARINPHFLYNSLNSIAGLAHSDPQKTEQMALSLSDLFRHSINRENQLTSTVLEEIEAVKAYLEIEQIRFGENMLFDLDVDEQAEEFILPRNIIQPLVENAIKHGISKIKEKGIISVMIKKGAEGILIVVTDNGPNFPDGNISGYGLQSVYDILNLSYKNEASLNWENEPYKRIWIKITNVGLNKTVENV